MLIKIDAARDLFFLEGFFMAKKNEAKGIMILGGLVIALVIFRVFIYPYFESSLGQ